ncbi:hypothetical protein V8G54_032216 [Vigna mungo]|uniref:Uncharacterized protein n=1 Tax=Vigna mungo TaxID=3915 RepID=A0AAQ3MLR4_VIGMU
MPSSSLFLLVTDAKRLVSEAAVTMASSSSSSELYSRARLRKSFFIFLSILTFFCPCGDGITFAFLPDFLRPCVLTNFLLALPDSTIAISSAIDCFITQLQPELTMSAREEFAVAAGVGTLG